MASDGGPDADKHHDADLPDLEARSVAAYVADLATQLALLARNADLALLAYLLDVVRLEADSTAKGQANSR